MDIAELLEFSVNITPQIYIFPQVFRLWYGLMAKLGSLACLLLPILMYIA